jgi:hypothetical protein
MLTNQLYPTLWFLLAFSCISLKKFVCGGVYLYSFARALFLFKFVISLAVVEWQQKYLTPIGLILYFQVPISSYFDIHSDVCFPSPLSSSFLWLSWFS